MTFFTDITFATENWVQTSVAALVLYLVAMGYEIFYSAFILDGYYEVANSDNLSENLMRVWVATLSIETIKLLAFYFFGKIFDEYDRGFLSMLVRMVLALHAIVVGFLPIAAIVCLVESIELVDEEDKMLALVGAYVITIIGVVTSLPWAYNMLAVGK